MNVTYFLEIQMSSVHICSFAIINSIIDQMRSWHHVAELWLVNNLNTELWLAAGVMSLLQMLSDSWSDKTNAGWKIWNIVVRGSKWWGLSLSPRDESWSSDILIFYAFNNFIRWQLHRYSHIPGLKTAQNLILTISLGRLSHLFGLTINSIKLKMN